MAQRRAAAAGLADRVRFHLRDYREEHGLDHATLKKVSLDAAESKEEETEETEVQHGD